MSQEKNTFNEPSTKNPKKIAKPRNKPKIIRYFFDKAV